MKLWEEDINKAGGLLGRPVKLVYYDDQSTPSNIPALYTKLLDVDKVDIVVSGYGTNMTVPAMPIVMSHNRMFMTLFALAVNADFKYPRFFGMIPAGPSEGARRAFSKGFFRDREGNEPAAKDAGDRRCRRRVIAQRDRGRAGQRERCGLAGDL